MVEATIDDIQRAIEERLITPQRLVRMYLRRIQAYDGASPNVNSYMHVNERALARAE